MKILHINSYYSTSSFYKNLFDMQIKQGLDIDVFIPISFDIDTKNFDYGDYSIVSKNHSKYDRLWFHLKHFKIYKDIKKNYKIEKYTLTHAHSLFSNGYISMKLKKEYGVPYIVAVRNTDVNVFFKKMWHLRSLGVEILKEASKIIFLSEAYKDQVIIQYIPGNLQKDILKKALIIPNGIDSKWLENKKDFKNKLNVSGKNINLVQVGDINVNKNSITTAKAVRLLIEDGYSVKLDIVGKIKNQKIYNELEEFPFVNYLGYQSMEGLVEVYKKNDIFVLPSIYETFGLVYAEAMSQGLPVIYSKGQGFDKQFPDGTVGLSVHCNEVDDIAKSIIKIYKQYDDYSTRAIKNADKFNWETISNSYTQIYQKLT